MVEEVFGAEDVDRHEIRVNPVGVNHFTWLTSAVWQNHDLFPHFLRYPPQDGPGPGGAGGAASAPAHKIGYAEVADGAGRMVPPRPPLAPGLTFGRRAAPEYPLPPRLRRRGELFFARPRLRWGGRGRTPGVSP